MRVALLEDEITVFELFAQILNLDIGRKLFVECSISLANATFSTHSATPRLECRTGGHARLFSPSSTAKCNKECLNASSAPSSNAGIKRCGI